MHSRRRKRSSTRTASRLADGRPTPRPPKPAASCAMHTLLADFRDRRGEVGLGLLLVLPAVLLIGAVNIYPVGYSLYQSLFDIHGLINKGFVGLQNYEDLLSSGTLYRS